MWRKSMRDISDALKKKMNFRHDAQLADFLSTTRQHLYVATREDRFLQDRIVQKAIENDIDLTRLIRDAVAVPTSDNDYSEAEITLSEYEEGDILPLRKRGIQKWMADFILKTSIDINSTISMVKIISDEMSNSLPRGSYCFIDSDQTKPHAGKFYLDVNGYGMLRTIMKAPEPDMWYLLAQGKEPSEKNCFTFNDQFKVIGKCIGLVSRL